MGPTAFTSAALVSSQQEFSFLTGRPRAQSRPTSLPSLLLINGVSVKPGHGVAGVPLPELLPLALLLHDLPGGLMLNQGDPGTKDTKHACLNALVPPLCFPHINHGEHYTYA